MDGGLRTGIRRSTSMAAVLTTASALCPSASSGTPARMCRKGHSLPTYVCVAQAVSLGFRVAQPGHRRAKRNEYTVCREGDSP